MAVSPLPTLITLQPAAWKRFSKICLWSDPTSMILATLELAMVSGIICNDSLGAGTRPFTYAATRFPLGLGRYPFVHAVALHAILVAKRVAYALAWISLRLMCDAPLRQTEPKVARIDV